jgi:hypothetical protein
VNSSESCARWETPCSVPLGAPSTASGAYCESGSGANPGCWNGTAVSGSCGAGNSPIVNCGSGTGAWGCGTGRSASR